MTLSRPQLDALRYVKGWMLFAEDINEGNGNMRRTILSLFKLGMLGWDPIYRGRTVLTELGEQKLAATRGTIDDPRSGLRIAAKETEP